MPNIDTLVKDIYGVIEGKGGWTPVVTQYFSDGLSKIASDRFTNGQRKRDYLSLSMLGNPCEVKLWRELNEPDSVKPLDGEQLGTFFYGDILELLLLSLAKAAGHSVELEQHEVTLEGVPGHIDAVIDGWLVDVKSASSNSLTKFYNNGLLKDDPYGYLSQISSYLYAVNQDETIKDKLKIKDKAAFLAVDKTRFKLVLDKYDLRKHLKNKQAEVLKKKQMVAGEIPQNKPEPVPQVAASEDRPANGNMMLNPTCKYCNFKDKCWPKARKFLYKKGQNHEVVYLTTVVKEPRVTEIKE